MFSVYTEYDDVALFHFHRLSFIGTASLRCHNFHFFPKPDVKNGRVHAVPILHGNVVMLPVSQKRYDRTISRDPSLCQIFLCLREYCLQCAGHRGLRIREIWENMPESLNLLD